MVKVSYPPKGPRNSRAYMASFVSENSTIIVLTDPQKPANNDTFHRDLQKLVYGG